MKYLKAVPLEDGSIEYIETDEVPVFEPPLPVEPPYNIKRMKEYPEVGNQLDMIWHMMEDDTIPGKGSTWYNSILEIKEKYPKQE